VKGPVSNIAVVEPGCVKIGTRLEDRRWQKSWWSWLCSLYIRQTGLCSPSQSLATML